MLLRSCFQIHRGDQSVPLVPRNGRPPHAYRVCHGSCGEPEHDIITINITIKYVCQHLIPQLQLQHETTRLDPQLRICVALSICFHIVAAGA